jgi:hypothetical protein
MRLAAVITLLFLALVAQAEEPKAKTPPIPPKAVAPTVEQRLLSLELKLELLRREVADLRDALAELADKKAKPPVQVVPPPAPTFGGRSYPRPSYPAYYWTAPTYRYAYPYAKPPYYSGGVWY